MCGIAGIVPIDPSAPVDTAVLRQMARVITHRGPDDEGQCAFAGGGLLSQRLAILDLSERGHMPMRSADGRFWIAHNGEIYNFRELRAELQQAGCTFVSDSDTEVILALYERLGPDCLHKMNGMFAFAIWDTQQRRLFAARDRLGVKPFYFAWHEQQLFFASEHKALFAAGVPREFDHGKWEDLICFRYVAGGETSYRGVRKLLPGHYLTFADGTLREHRWWNLSQRIRDAAPDARSPRDRFVETFDSAVALRRISDVPVGVFLSGGLDSSLVAASVARMAGPGVAAFTVRFPEKEFDEGPASEAVSRRWKLDHHTLTLAPDDLPDLLRKAAWLNDEPLVHGTEAHLFALARLAKPLVTVALSGEGADETLGGYVRYRPLLHPAGLKVVGAMSKFGTLGLRDPRLRKLSRFATLSDLDRVITYNACDVLPGELPALGLQPAWQSPYRAAVLREAKQLYTEPVRQAMYLDQHTFLQSVLDLNDRTTMGASVECRVPFLDYRMVELSGGMPTEHLLKLRAGKLPIRTWLRDRLPERVLKARKWGFGVPWSRYFRSVTPLRDGLRALASSPFIADSPLDAALLATLVARFEQGDLTVFPMLFRVYLIDLAWRAGTAKS